MRRDLYCRADLERLLDPASIAIVGASPRAGSFGQRVTKNLADFEGHVYPVNSKYQEIEGRACYRSLAEIAEAPDCVVVAAPREQVEDIVKECCRLGVGGIVLFASGYAEIGDEERIAEQARLVAIARAANVRLVGPNCIGFVNYRTEARSTFIAAPARRASGAPAIGLVSQSGALGFALGQAMARGVNFSHILTAGNSADVDVADYIAYLAEDNDCAAIACVFEGMKDPLRFISAADRARAARKPVVVYKIATGERGAAAALSHTGSLAGANDAYMAAFERAGIVVADTFETLVETTAFFAKTGRAKSTGVAVLSTSGGAAIMAADTADTQGVPLPQPSEAAAEVLASKIPDFGSTRNPFDITAQVLSDPESFVGCVEALFLDPAYGSVVVPIAFATETVVQRITAFEEIARRHGKAACVVWLPQWREGPGSHSAETSASLAVFHSMESCFSTLAKWHQWSRDVCHPSTPPVVATPAGILDQARRALSMTQGCVVTERTAKALLKTYGVPMVQDRLATSLESCLDAAADCGYPVALKVESHAIPHKTEAGVVRLNIADAPALNDAYESVMANALKATETSTIEGVLVQPMVPNGVEVFVGARIDPLFGPLVIVGLGGIMVELLRDSAVALAPLHRHDAVRMLRKLKGSQLFDGFRGSEPVDLEALADIVCRVGDFAFDHRDRITELDINPIICSTGRMVGVDALIALRALEGSAA